MFCIYILIFWKIFWMLNGVDFYVKKFFVYIKYLWNLGFKWGNKNE